MIFYLTGKTGNQAYRASERTWLSGSHQLHLYFGYSMEFDEWKYYDWWKIPGYENFMGCNSHSVPISNNKVCLILLKYCANIRGFIIKYLNEEEFYYILKLSFKEPCVCQKHVEADSRWIRPFINHCYSFYLCKSNVFARVDYDQLDTKDSSLHCVCVYLFCRSDIQTRQSRYVECDEINGSGSFDILSYNTNVLWNYFQWQYRDQSDSWIPKHCISIHVLSNSNYLHDVVTDQGVFPRFTAFSPSDVICEYAFLYSIVSAWSIWQCCDSIWNRAERYCI